MSDVGETRLRLAGTWTAEKDATILPYGSHPGFTSLIERRFNRSGEKAVHIGWFQKFDRLGLPGIRFTANYTHGWTPDSGWNASPDQSELDLTLGYRKQFKNDATLWFRLRGAWLEEKTQPESRHTEDYRIILQYDVPLFR